MHQEHQDAAVRAVAARGKLALDEAEDVVFAAMLKVMSARPRVADPGAYLVTASLNELTSRKRRVAYGPGFVPLPDHSRNDGAGEVHEAPEDVADSNIAQFVEKEEALVQSAQIQAAMAQLPASDRALLNAYYSEQRPLRDIDRDNGSRPGTAKLHVHRARQKLRVLMGLTVQPNGRSV